jgi:hypothetical protein
MQAGPGRTRPQAADTALAGRGTTAGRLRLALSPWPSCPFCAATVEATTVEVSGDWFAHVGGKGAHLVASPRPQLPVGVDGHTVAGGGAGGDEDDSHVAERRQHVGHNQVVGVLEATRKASVPSEGRRCWGGAHRATPGRPTQGGPVGAAGDKDTPLRGRRAGGFRCGGHGAGEGFSLSSARDVALERTFERLSRRREHAEYEQRRH